MSHTHARFAPQILLAVATLALAACGSSSSDTRPAGPPQFAELMPVSMAPPPPPPPPPEPAPMAAPPPPPAGPTYGGHLASYSREADAIRGWNSILRQHSSIGTLKRHLVTADTPKGRMIRVIAGDFPSLDEVNRFCSWAKQQNLYCAVMQLSPDRMTASPLPLPARAARTPRTPAAMAPAAPAAPMMAPAPMAPAAPMAAPAAPAPAAAPATPPATAPARPLTAPRG